MAFRPESVAPGREDHGLDHIEEAHGQAELLQEATRTGGGTERLRWTVRKRGQSYGLALAAPQVTGGTPESSTTSAS